MRRRLENPLTIAFALFTALAIAAVPLTAGGQEDGRAANSKPGPAVGADDAGADPATGWDGDGPAPRNDSVSSVEIESSLCVGVDCVINGEVYGFDTIRLKENNLRIMFVDTSVAASFPRRDWQLVANQSANGGLSYFGIRDCGDSDSGGSSECGTRVFAVEGGADNDSIYVDSNGNQGGHVGFGTASPAVDLHTLSGNTPTLRLDQDGSNGFTPQTWDLAGNEANFFVRDVTNGSALPLRIEPGTATNTVYLDSTERVGINENSPDASLHIKGLSSGILGIKIEENVAGGTNIPTIQLENTNAAGSPTWTFAARDNGVLAILDGTGDHETLLQPNGDVRIEGSLLAEGGDNVLDPGDTFPDYVFDTGYELMSVADLAAFIEANGHLPGVMNARDVAAEGAINMTLLQLQLLEKVEELALYTIGQQGTIDSQQGEITALRAENAQLRADLQALLAAVGALRAD